MYVMCVYFITIIVNVVFNWLHVHWLPSYLYFNIYSVLYYAT